MADGGEGTLDFLLSTTRSEKVPITCTGPLGEKITTYYGITQFGTAIIEIANIAGLVQVPEEKRNPDETTTFGIGEVILDALDRGCQSLIIGIGGSATNDGGLGMMIALGMTAKNKAGNKLDGYGKDLLQLDKVDFTDFDPRLAEISIKVASDVDNPLCGKMGATVVYGPQKGATSEQIELYDKALDNYSDVIEAKLNNSFKQSQGAGAAGGLGFALLTMGAKLVSGAKLIAEEMHLEEVIEGADLVITGEGQSDEQTLFGKAPGYVATIAKSYDVPVILISGSIIGDRKSTRLNSSHVAISYAVFCLKKKIKTKQIIIEHETKNER